MVKIIPSPAFSDEGDLAVLRYKDWKAIFMEQRYERVQKASNTYYNWVKGRVYLLLPAAEYVSKFMATFKDYPSRMKAVSFTLGDAVKSIQS